MNLTDDQDTAILGAYRAIEEAIYTEEGLDGLVGETVLTMLNDAFPTNVPDQRVSRPDDWGLMENEEAANKIAYDEWQRNIEIKR